MSQPSPDHLLKVIQLNTINAFTRNATVLGLETDWLICHAISPFGKGVESSKVGRQFAPSQCPVTLVPTTLQMSIEHHPWVDLFPSPRMRDNFFTAMIGNWDEEKEEQLWNDLVETGGDIGGTGLIVWGDPWDARSWEATVPFLRKWGWILQGCHDILRATNYWRRGNGFIASHILNILLSRGYDVITSVRNEKKATKLRAAHENLEPGRLQIEIISDVAVPGAFDKVFQIPGTKAVIHAASPFHFNSSDPQKEVIEPALGGTLLLLGSAKEFGKDVQRVVITSSFAAILDNARMDDPNTIFTEWSLNPATIDHITISKDIAYRVSKNLAEKAAWNFVASEKPQYTLSTIDPPLVFGPLTLPLESISEINTSNSAVVDLLAGKWRENTPESTVFVCVDVRDVALAHILAMEKEEAANQRFLTIGNRFGNRDIVDIVRRNFPEYADKLPTPDVKGGELPSKDEMHGYDNSKTTNILGIKWRPLETSIVDLVKSLAEYNI
nr:ketoreductase [Colletotrichum truncatum]KAF6784200.1 ketoreductase [Colletotrichum truncatum]